MGATYSASEIRALAEASISLTSELSLEAVLQKVVDVAREQVGAKYAALSVLNREGEIERFITAGISDEERARIGHIPHGRGLLSVLLHEGATLRMDDMSKDPRSVGFPPNHPPMKSLLGIPVVSQGKILGNLYLTEKQEAGGFDERDEDIVLLLSGQAAVAIRNAELYEAAGRRAGEWQALFELSRELRFSAELDGLLGSVVQRATRLLDAEVGVLILRTPDGLGLRLAAHDGLRATPSGEAISFPANGLVHDVMQTGESAIVDNRRTDQRVRANPVPLLDAEGITSAIEVPLKGKDSVMGVIIAGNRERTTYTVQQAELLETFANLTAVAIETRQLYDKLESLARLEERERIGMDLHDGVIQSIYAVALHLEDTADRLPGDSDEMRHDIERAMDDLNKVIKDIRSYIFDLRPQLSHVDDLPGALTVLVEQFRINTLIDVRLDVSEPFDGAGGEAPAMALFHIAQEALNNVSKHSKATTVDVRLQSSESSMTLEVTDNGVGFDVPPEDLPSARNGLRNMRDRARSVGASLAYVSKSGAGTTVRVALPVKRKDGGLG